MTEASAKSVEAFTGSGKKGSNSPWRKKNQETKNYKRVVSFSLSLSTVRRCVNQDLPSTSSGTRARMYPQQDPECISSIKTYTGVS